MGSVSSSARVKLEDWKQQKKELLRLHNLVVFTQIGETWMLVLILSKIHAFYRMESHNTLLIILSLCMNA